MVQQWLDKVPRWLLAIIVVVGVLLFMIANEPPTSICDVQMENVSKALQKHFNSPKEDGWADDASISAKYKLCLRANSLGGCYRLLTRLNYYEKMSRSIPSQCKGHDAVKPMGPWMFKSINLIARLAWGEEPPEEDSDVVGWLDEGTVALFCRLSGEYVRLFGPGALKGAEKATMKSLPGIEKVYQKDRREKTLFAHDCRQYMRY